MAEDSNCCWQINLNAHPQYDGERLRSDPAYCAQAAYEISEGGANWHPWSTYTNGAYLAYVDQAPSAVAAPDGGGDGGSVQTSAQPNISPWLLLGGLALALWAIEG